MWCTRVYKDSNTNKIIGLRLFDETSNSYLDFSPGEVKTVLKQQPNFVHNLTLDKNNRIKIKCLNPKTNYKYHAKTEIDTNVIACHLAIITSHRNGALNIIADNIDNNTFTLEGVTISDVANKLKVSDLDKLVISNAYTSIENNKYWVYWFNGVNYIKIPSLVQDFTKHYLNPNKWVYKLDKIGQEGLYIKSLHSKKGVGALKLPSKIYSIQRFKGYVNELEITESTKIIHKACFSCLDDLNKVILPSNLEKIPEKCFFRSALDEVVFGGNEKIIDKGAFFECDRLNKLTGCNAEIIKSHAFTSTSLKVVDLKNIAEIEYKAFSENPRLRSVYLGNKIKYIGDSAFSFCHRLDSLTIDGTPEIGCGAFEGCLKLKKVTLNKGTKTYKNSFPSKTIIDWRE